MHTHNVNVAASESSKTWEKASSLWSARKNHLLIALAKIEGDLLMYRTFEEMDIGTDDYHKQYACSFDAAEIVESLRAIGAITSGGVLEMVRAVESLSLALKPDNWRYFHPKKLPDLAFFIREGDAKREKYLVEAAESLMPFCVIVEGRKEYPEDDPNYGTFWRDGSLTLGRAWTVPEAMGIAAAAWLENEWDPREEDRDYYDSDFGRDMGPVSFSPRMFIIHDKERRRVLAGDAREMTWYAHVSDPAEIARIQAEQKALREEAAMESGWDNFETARQLRAKAEEAGAPLVDDFWLGHPDVIAALNEFTRPERKVWGSRLNTCGLSRFMAEDMICLISLSDSTSCFAIPERNELIYSLALSIAGHVSRSVTDWTLPQPKVPAAVISAWLLTKDIVVARFGFYGEEVWSEIKGSLISHLNRPAG